MMQNTTWSLLWFVPPKGGGSACSHACPGALEAAPKGPCGQGSRSSVPSSGGRGEVGLEIAEPSHPSSSSSSSCPCGLTGTLSSF